MKTTRSLLVLLVLALLLAMPACATAQPPRPGRDIAPVMVGTLTTGVALPSGHGEITWQCVSDGQRVAWGNPEQELGIYAIRIAQADYCEARANWYALDGALVAQSALATIEPVQPVNLVDFVLLPH